VSNNIDAAVQQAIQQKGVTRLTHFTPARNLPHIFSGGYLMSVAQMTEDVRAYYTSTDENRFDGHPELLSCSIQYPNAFYLQKARGAPKAQNYPEWACLLIDPTTAARVGSLFSPRNAAAGSGSLLTAGLAGFEACYASTVLGSGGQMYTRGPHHNLSSPTDVQAEVLVPTPISIDLILGVVMASEALVTQEQARLRRLQLDPDAVRWFAAEGFFRTMDVTTAVQRSIPINEQIVSTE
jgi:ssDNA thymidine ADP-ribosyltransferase, DarT